MNCAVPHSPHHHPNHSTFEIDLIFPKRSNHPSLQKYSSIEYMEVKMGDINDIIGSDSIFKLPIEVKKMRALNNWTKAKVKLNLKT